MWQTREGPKPLEYYCKVELHLAWRSSCCQKLPLAQLSTQKVPRGNVVEELFFKSFKGKYYHHSKYFSTSNWLWVLSFGMIQIRSSDQRLIRSWHIKRTEKSTWGKDSSVHVMHHDPSDLRPLIQIQITQRNVPLDSLANLSQQAIADHIGHVLIKRGTGTIYDSQGSRDHLKGQ